ncbi:MAG: TetR/AcrR family transcriptional regulator [Leptolyngbyaceae bacterium]|nr:TetR/AcrR family transcriptional regulator [Leptolyngbyaceae bacterium]
MVDIEFMEKNTAQRILDVAQDIVRNRGYSAFSYADISQQVGIRKASIHYHFASKEELVKRLVQRYRDGMARACDRISKLAATPEQKLMEFANLYRDGLVQHQICLCAMLAADFEVLPESIQDEIRGYFQQVEEWLSTLLQQGCDDGFWNCSPSPEHEAKTFISLFQGAQLLARSAANGDKAYEQIIYPVIQSKCSIR